MKKILGLPYGKPQPKKEQIVLPAIKRRVRAYMSVRKCEKERMVLPSIRKHFKIPQYLLKAFKYLDSQNQSMIDNGFGDYCVKLFKNPVQKRLYSHSPSPLQTQHRTLQPHRPLDGLVIFNDLSTQRLQNLQFRAQANRMQNSLTNPLL